MKNHELYVLETLKETKDIDSLRTYHLRQIAWLQHERFIHLCVLMMTTFIFLSSVVLVLFKEIIAINLLSVILGVLEVFYMLHYFRLENTTQRWYKIANTMDFMLNGTASNLYVGNRRSKDGTVVIKDENPTF